MLLKENRYKVCMFVRTKSKRENKEGVRTEREKKNGGIEVKRE